MFKDRKANILFFSFFLLFTFLVIVLNSLVNNKITIRIAVASVESIEVGVTKVKYKGFKLGTVTNITPQHEYSTFLLTVELDSPNKTLRSSNTIYWIQEPANSDKTPPNQAYIGVVPAKGEFKQMFIAQGEKSQ